MANSVSDLVSDFVSSILFCAVVNNIIIIEPARNRWNERDFFWESGVLCSLYSPQPQCTEYISNGFLSGKNKSSERHEGCRIALCWKRKNNCLYHWNIRDLRFACEAHNQPCHKLRFGKFCRSICVINICLAQMWYGTKHCVDQTTFLQSEIQKIPFEDCELTSNQYYWGEQCTWF